MTKGEQSVKGKHITFGKGILLNGINTYTKRRINFKLYYFYGEKIYSRPYMAIERFLPNHYCVHQYEYCGDNWIRVTITDGVPQYEGHENATHEGEGQPQDVRSVTNITPNILTLNEGDDITYGEWQSFYSGLEFNHHGNGKVLSKDMTWEGHPNHS